MISDNFYPEAYSLNGGEISLTADVLTLSDSIADNMLPYYIGYVSYENMPSHWKFNTAEIVNDNTVSVAAITQNYGWGFLYHWNDMDGSNIAMMRPCLIADVSGTKTDLSGTTYSHHFVNHGIIASANFANSFRLFFCYIAMPTEWLTDDNSCIYSKSPGRYCEALTQNINLSYEQIIDFLDNNGTIILNNLQYGTRSNSVTLHASDFNDETHTAMMVSSDTPNYTVFIQLVNMYAYGQQAYVQGNNTITNSRFTPFFAMDIKGNGTTVSDQKALVCPNNLGYASGHYLNITFDNTGSDQQKMTAIGYSSNDYSKVGSSYIGNLKFLNGLTQQDFRQRGHNERAYYWYADGGIIRGRYIVSGGNTLTCGVAVPMEIEDMRRIACFLMNKIETNVTGSAQVSDFTNASRGYTTDFSTALFDKATSDPLEGGTRVYQNFVDIADKLCLWQYPYTDMSVDRFTEDLIPEYTPPGPEPEDDERTSGSWRANSDLANFGNANGFVTQYVITGNQLQNLGHYLWSGFWDEDFIDSIMVSFLENFSLYPADILKYFVSIRKYPLDLNGATYNLGWASELYIGRGKKGIKLDASTNTIGVLPNFAHIIRTEWKEIPSNFHDFRDYEPCCRVVIFVPFCGEVELTPSQAIGSEVRLEYCIDFSNGAVECAVVIRPAEKPNDLYIVAVLTGSMGASIQLSASNLTQFLMNGTKAITGQVQSLIQDVGTAVTMAAGAMEAGEGTSIDKGKYLGGLTSTAGGHVGDSLSSITGLVGTPVPKFGNNSGFSSFLVLTPNIQITYRWYEQPSNYGHAVGYACNKAVKIGDLTNKGFSVFRNVDLSGVPATQDELAAIEALLQSGVYL